MDGSSIMSKVRKTYLEMESYRDVGTARSVPAIGYGTPIEFMTFFIRPSKFRFEWKMWHPHETKSDEPMDAVIWKHKKVQASFHLLGEEMEIDFAEALEGAMGVSSGSVLMITKLLIPDCVERNRVWYEMENARVLGTELIEGFSCHHLVSDLNGKSDIEAWIGENDFLVRRVKEQDTPLSTEQRMFLEQAMKQIGAQYRESEAEGYTEYSYTTVRINETLDEALFCKRAP